MKKQRAWLAALWAAAMAVMAPEAAAREWTADANGCKVWNTQPAMKEAVEWSGACIDGFAEGRGELRWAVNGQPTRTYKGDMKAGRRSGQGVATMSLGMRYEGGFLDDVYAGQGSLYFPNGRSSRGEFVAGQLDGNCMLTWHEGTTYEGACKRGNADGSGKFAFANGDSYTGIARSGRPAEQGRYNWAGGDSYEGTFVAGHPSGSGVYRFANGSRYEGGFNSGLPSGRGRLEMVDGSGYEGQFEAGAPASPGALLSVRGTPPEDSPQLRTKMTLPYAKTQSVNSLSQRISVGMVCRVMPRPQLPVVQWKGQAIYKAVATVREGRIVGAEYTILSAGVDRTVHRAFIESMERAFQAYDCPGNHVFEQEFMFSTK
ncbi:hypothetical protein [Roseateles asaccharophilus]|uniref:MORN repeat protein n=1 Tax=Roseateles asaccharophilus TaxID=582607 RepID=A0ABU2AEY8_9BURK|nr:hypothetical protein [Roseateles asaccharophilus]MDR7335540.1 hypothetical protein [Roseateles asaccharophilus]